MFEDERNTVRHVGQARGNRSKVWDIDKYREVQSDENIKETPGPLQTFEGKQTITECGSFQVSLKSFDE